MAANAIAMATTLIEPLVSIFNTPPRNRLQMCYFFFCPKSGSNKMAIGKLKDGGEATERHPIAVGRRRLDAVRDGAVAAQHVLDDRRRFARHVVGRVGHERQQQHVQLVAERGR